MAGTVVVDAGQQSAGERVVPRRAWIALLVFAALLRVGVVAVLWERPPADDELAYHALAESLVAGRGYTSERNLGLVNPGAGAPTSIWGCLQPLYLAAIRLLFGGSAGWAYLVNALVSVVAVICAIKLATHTGSGRVSVVAGLLIAADVYLLKFTATLLTETLFITLLWAALWALLLWTEASGRRATLYALSAGALFGLASLTRGLAYYFAFLALAWVLWERRRSGRPFGWQQVAGFVLALFVVLSPWIVRNRIVHDRPVLLDTKAGWNLYAFLHPEFEPLRGNRVAIPADVLEPSVSESRRNEMLVARALEFARDDPWHVLEMAPQKLWLLWSPFPGRLTDPRLGPVKLGFVLPLELLALLGALRVGARLRVARLVYLLIAYYVLVHSLMTGGPRFRAPLDPGLAILAGCAFASRRSADQSRTSSTPA